MLLLCTVPVKSYFASRSSRLSALSDNDNVTENVNVIRCHDNIKTLVRQWCYSCEEGMNDETEFHFIEAL